MAKRSVISLLEMVWAKSLKATGHSWDRLNTSMRQALHLAIRSGFEFAKADFMGLEKFRPSYWMGESDEWCYSLAVTEGNFSAAVAYEGWKGREPIIADDVDGLDKKRLHVGARFEWMGEKVTVTSFNTAGAAVACSYHPGKGDGDGWGRKVKKRYTITRELVVRERAERKQRDAILVDLVALKAANPSNTAIDFVKEFGTKDMKVVRAMPFAKFVKIAERIKAKVA